MPPPSTGIARLSESGDTTTSRSGQGTLYSRTERNLESDRRRFVARNLEDLAEPSFGRVARNDTLVVLHDEPCDLTLLPPHKRTYFDCRLARLRRRHFSIYRFEEGEYALDQGWNSDLVRKIGPLALDRLDGAH